MMFLRILFSLVVIISFTCLLQISHCEAVTFEKLKYASLSFEWNVYRMSRDPSVRWYFLRGCVMYPQSEASAHNLGASNDPRVKMEDPLTMLEEQRFNADGLDACNGQCRKINIDSRGASGVWLRNTPMFSLCFAFYDMSLPYDVDVLWSLYDTRYPDRSDGVSLMIRRVDPYSAPIWSEHAPTTRGQPQQGYGLQLQEPFLVLRPGHNMRIPIIPSMEGVPYIDLSNGVREFLPRICTTSEFSVVNETLILDQLRTRTVGETGGIKFRCYGTNNASLLNSVSYSEAYMSYIVEKPIGEALSDPWWNRWNNPPIVAADPPPIFSYYDEPRWNNWRQRKQEEEREELS